MGFKLHERPNKAIFRATNSTLPPEKKIWGKWRGSRKCDRHTTLRHSPNSGLFQFSKRYPPQFSISYAPFFFFKSTSLNCRPDKTNWLFSTSPESHNLQSRPEAMCILTSKLCVSSRLFRVVGHTTTTSRYLCFLFSYKLHYLSNLIF